MKRVAVILVVLVTTAGIATAGVLYYQRLNKPPGFRTAAVQRGDLQHSISATGTLQAEEVVDIGAQVAGQIKSFGVDPHEKTKNIDYCTAVEEGTVLAQIDDTLFKSDVDQADAAVKVAEASLTRAKADRDQLEVKSKQAKRDWQRAVEIKKKGGVVGDQELETYESTSEAAELAWAVGKAAVDQAEKSLLQAKATWEKANKNLGYCTIRSPVKGVIIDRRVNVGQTVVSSLNAPSLFLIAKDLKRMQVWVQVNEADIGQIHARQKVKFNVDAHPNRDFFGEVGKIRLNATMTQNVVTYTVEVNTENEDLKLLPYLTANLQFEVEQRTNVLLVPNAALRWWPQADRIAPDAREAMAAKAARGKDKARDKSPAEAGSKDTAERGTIWVQDGKFVRPIRVRVGYTDGANTEVSGEGVSEGLEIVIGDIRTSSSNGTSNPFAPKMFGGGSGKSQ
jgi:HlyD family secretion protein